MMIIDFIFTNPKLEKKKQRCWHKQATELMFENRTNGIIIDDFPLKWPVIPHSGHWENGAVYVSDVTIKAQQRRYQGVGHWTCCKSTDESSHFQTSLTLEQQGIYENQFPIRTFRDHGGTQNSIPGW